MGSHVFQGAEMKISFTKEFKRGLWNIDHQLTADEWGRGHCIAQGPMGDQVNVFLIVSFFFNHKGE